MIQLCKTLVSFLFRCCGAAQTCDPSLHRNNGEGSPERAGLAQGRLLPSDPEFHRTEIPLCGFGEAEAPGPQGPEERNRDRHAGATRQLQCHHWRNGEISGEVSQVDSSTLVKIIELNLIAAVLSSDTSSRQTRRRPSQKLRMLIPTC